MASIPLDIVVLVNEIRGSYSIPFTENTTLQEDLNIWGDDAVEFLEEFSNRFGVDISEFDFDKYFKSEGDPILQTIIRLIKRGKTPKYTPLTLGDLKDAMEKGKLI